MTSPPGAGLPLAGDAALPGRPRLLAGRLATTPTWSGAIGPVISMAVLVAAVAQLRRFPLADALRLVPSAPLFWLALAGAYLALPASEWLIYRRFWALPVEGILPLLRKRISNEILLGYSGEVYFHHWVRHRLATTRAPFGIIKDVAILSAQMGNLVTLLLAVLAWPLLGPLHLDARTRDLALSALVIVLVAMAPLLVRRRLMTLPAPALGWIATIHLLRIGLGLLLAALMWHEALPAIAWSWWLLLAALRQMLSRLPFMPNKDVAFAGLTAYLIGTHAGIAAMVTMTASLILALHLLLGTVLALADLILPPKAA